MRNIAYKILDYFYEHERARKWWMYVSFIGLTLSAYSLSWWQYALVILFGVMLTRAKLGVELDLDNRNAAIAAPVALLLFGLLAFVLAKGFGSTELPNTSGTVPTQQSTSTISDLVFKPYLLPFWALSFVLLAAVIGAIVLARKD